MCTQRRWRRRKRKHRRRRKHRHKHRRNTTNNTLRHHRWMNTAFLCTRLASS